jgi:hypothetical protein
MSDCEPYVKLQFNVYCNYESRTLISLFPETHVNPLKPKAHINKYYLFSPHRKKKKQYFAVKNVHVQRNRLMEKEFVSCFQGSEENPSKPCSRGFR